MADQKTNSTSLLRTRSDQLAETVATIMKSPTHSSSETAAAGAAVENGGTGTGTLSRKSSKRLAMPSPGRSGSSTGKNAHIRKWSSAQMKFDLDDVSSGAALSRASSASLGLSFSFTGFTMPPDEIADSKPFSDDDIQDLEAGTRKKKIHTEPTLPIYLKFTDVSYKIVIKGVTSTIEKDILNGITGSVNPGEVLALMGPSGSGKTTLLSLLGGRLRGATTGGSVTYNDQPYSKFLKSRIGFVTQDDVLFPHLTVKETLTFAAQLRLPSILTKQQKEQRAVDVIYELGLERCQDTMIGGSFVRGVSGGERKRVCIGNEIIINPSLLFLDEPTSGLDSTTALRIVELLQDIAEAGKTVITTIHQPSSRLFHKFDKLILLGKGNLLYFGKAAEAMVYFSSVGCSPLIAMNPAEFLLDLANGNLNDVSVPSELEDRVQLGNTETETRNGRPSPTIVHEQYLVESYETRVAENEKKKLLVPLQIDEAIKSQVCSKKREWGASWFEQYSILFWRGLKERRHDYFSWLRITQVLATAVILGMLWWQSGSNNPKEVQDQAGLLFFISVFWGFFPVFTAIFTFPQERAMLSKERAADMYRLSAYFVARTTSDIPLDLLLPVLFLLVVYFMAGLRLNAGSFFLTVVTVFLCIVAAQGFGLAIGATLMDLKKSTTLASVTVMTFMLAGGYFVKKVPVFISWLSYLSFNYHTYKLLLKVQYEHISHTIEGIRIDSGFKEVSVLAAMVVGYRLLAYVSLRRMKLQPGT
ncbi:ABC transporter G family member 22-like isoform X1 [Coffea arabica]|uniref:ABC transporter G family member 22-like isoform X1 n=1 Tax=Coffea arabica TaxID=13443 RepID=A0ABM4UMN5_COFAR|nr:ABC transporter G family member 22 isoform X1 [Coffea arabica]XP_027068476.1 ABC transporter G family member 22 isoform X1 [Coffea arabica]